MKKVNLWMDSWATRAIGTSQEEQWHIMRWLGYSPVKCMSEGMRVLRITFSGLAVSREEVMDVAWDSEGAYDNPKEFDAIMRERYSEVEYE